MGILSMFGIANEFNTTLWLSHIFIINPTVVGTVWILKKLAYDTAATECQASTADACDVQDDISFSMLTDVASQAAIYLTFSLSGEAWLRQQLYNMDEEAQLEWMEKLGKGKGGKKGDDMKKEGEKPEGDRPEEEKPEGEKPEGELPADDQLFSVFNF